MTVRCKFVCTSVTKRQHWNGKNHIWEASFSPVGSASSPENAVFFAATPSGNITVGTIAADHFEVGREYYVDFVPAAAAEPVA